MNIAILSASRKVWLIRAFQQALTIHGGGMVFALDNDEHSAAFQVADGFDISPLSNTPLFPKWLAEWCKQKYVSLVIPTRDAELPIVAQLAASFLSQGIRIAVSPAEAITTCQDKRAFANICSGIGIKIPREIDSNSDSEFPAFLKSRFAYEKKVAETIESRSSLKNRGFNPEKEILQEFIRLPEFTIDVFVDWEGRLISAVPRARVRVFAGETVVGVTVSDMELAEAAGKLAIHIGLRGPLTVQAFRGQNQIYFFEINPRFAGGAALSIAAGCPIPEWLVCLEKGEILIPKLGQFEPGLWMFRHSTDIIVKQ